MTKLFSIDDAQRSLDDLALLRRDACDQIWDLIRRAASQVEDINERHYRCRAFTESELRGILYEAEILVERLTVPTERAILEDATPPEPFDGDYPDWLRGDR